MTVASISRRPWAAGLILWAVAVVAIPAPLAARLWLAVPFVLVPCLAPAAEGEDGPAGPLATRPWWVLASGVLVAGALVAPIGSFQAGALVVPWLLLALSGLAVAWRPRRTIRSIGALGRVGAAMFLVVGAASLLLERLGIAPLGFDPTIVLLTAVHFSVAGYALLAEAVLLAGSGSGAGRGAIAALLVGILVTAIGWLGGTPATAWPGTVVVAAAGSLVAWALVSGARRATRWERAARLVGGVSLAIGMVLAIGWSTALVLGTPYLDIAGMVRTHGALNLLAVVLAAWSLGRGVAPPLRSVVERHLRGALIALGLALPVAAWIAWGPHGWIPAALTPPLLVSAALIGPACAGWILADHPSTSLFDRALRVFVMALAATLAAATVAATLMAVDSQDPWKVAMGIPFYLVMGLGLLGPLALVAAVPFATGWVLVSDRLTWRPDR